MKRHNVKVAVDQPAGPNRLLVALAAAWMILSLALGGAVAAESPADAAAPAPAPITGTTAQP
jgi:hypothetical protein